MQGRMLRSLRQPGACSQYGNGFRRRATRSFLSPALLILDDLGLHWRTAQQFADLYELILDYILWRMRAVFTHTLRQVRNSFAARGNI